MLIQNLINHLDVPDTNYWYDYGCEVARNIIDENHDRIFSLLLTEWGNWPVTRQVHLAYILGEGSSIQELALINEMLTSKNEEVVFRAKEALIDFYQKT